MLRNPNSELIHSPEDFACLAGAFPLLLARPHHRHCDARHHSRCHLLCLISPLRCAAPRSCSSRSSRIPSVPCRARPSAPSLQSATSFQLLVAVCLVAYSDARVPNPGCSSLCSSSKTKVSEGEAGVSEGSCSEQIEEARRTATEVGFRVSVPEAVFAVTEAAGTGAACALHGHEIPLSSPRFGRASGCRVFQGCCQKRDSELLKLEAVSSYVLLPQPLVLWHIGVLVPPKSFLRSPLLRLRRNPLAGGGVVLFSQRRIFSGV
jgi:hypothetical protein